MRKITLFSTKGGKKVVETEAKTWGQLKPLVIDAGYDLDNLVAAENINKTTLESSEAKLPDGNFTVFLRPVQTKSGADFDNMGFRQLREELDDDIKEYLSKKYTNKNWTQLTTSELREGLKSYYTEDGDGAEEDTVNYKPIPATEVSFEDLNPLEKLKVAEKLIDDAIEEFNSEYGNEDVDCIAEDIDTNLEGLIIEFKEYYDETNDAGKLVFKNTDEDDELRREFEEFKETL